MCGIAGFSLNTTSPDVERLARSLLLGIEERGRDASGLAWHGRENQLWIMKDAVAASRLVNTLTGEPDGARHAILHTRYATLGSPDQWANNHPIENNGVVGVHNGVIHNHDEIFSLLRDEVGKRGKVERHGRVDSEAIFALLSWAANGTIDATPGELLALLDGSAAVAWLHQNDPETLHLARVNGSPLIVGHTVKGNMIFASTVAALNKAAMAGGFRLVQMGPIPEGTYLQVRSGKIVHVERFDVGAKPRPYVKPNYDRPSRFEPRVVRDWRASTQTLPISPLDAYLNDEITWDQYRALRPVGHDTDEEVV